MTDPAPRRRRWLWVAVVLLLLGVSVLPGTYLFIRWQGERELAAVRAELDAADPNWRLPDLIAARNARLAKLPVNSADTAVAAVKLLPDFWDKDLGDYHWPGDGPPNRQPTADQADKLRATHAKTEPARRLALTIRDQPDGGSVITVPDYRAYTVNIDLTPVQKRRAVAQTLSIAAAVAALENDPAAAVAAIRAGLNVGRSIGDEPLLISQLVRIACTQIAVRAAERALGLCEPADGLAELQAAFEREAGERFMAAGLRGELASVDQVMSNMRAGTVGGTVAGMPSGGSLNPYWSHDHAAGIRLIRAAAEDAGRPHAARTGSAEAERALLAEPQFRVPMSQLLAPAVGKCSEADVRLVANLTVAAVGLACERHRRATGRWPESLAELPKSLLPAVPVDPFDGQPLRFKRTADGIVVYSVGQNRTDDGGIPPPGNSATGDVVFRLYDPANRRLPALPPAPAVEP